jgi:hypothetical protein
MGNPSPGAQGAGAPGGARGANQTLIVAFERDESLAGSLLGQLRAQGYESRSARTPVEVFDLIARYPVRLVLVNLGQPATSRREFWVALDAQRLGRGVQVITYRYLVPGLEPDSTDASGRPDVEVRGPHGFAALLEAVRAKLPPPMRPSLDSSFLLGSGALSRPQANGQPAPAAQPGGPAMAPSRNPPEYAARQQAISGVLNLSHGMQPGQQPEFMPLPGAAIRYPANGGWVPDMNTMPPMPGGQPMNGGTEQQAPQWQPERAEPAAMPAEPGPPGWPGAPPAPARPGNSHMNGASSIGTPSLEGFPRDAPFNPSMPMGDLAALSDAINALAAAGAPGYRRAAAAAAQAMNASNLPGSEASRWDRGQSHAVQEIGAGVRAPIGSERAGTQWQPATEPRERAAGERAWQSLASPDGSGEAAAAGARASGQAGGTYPAGAPPDMPEERKPSGSMNGVNQMNQGGQAPARSAAETLYIGQQAFAELGRAQEAQPPQDTRSHTRAPNPDEFDYQRRERAAAMQGNGNEPTAAPSRRLSEDRGPMAGGGQPTAYQNQMLAPVVAPGRVERSLGNVLVEGQLISPQRLEVALGIQRLLRGVDIDYRLGEVLLLFKFLTPDQLLAALLVSRGLVAPAQVAAMGRIKQELHNIGLEYDLENLLILFRLLTSEQLREVRSDFS